ncbi:MAG: CoA transferase [Thermoproteus sp.]
MAKYRAVELAVLYPGPLAGRLLAEWGFDVVKVEPPGGDPMRAYSPTLYRLLNEGKELVVLDLKTEEGRRSLYDLVKGADAVLTSFRPAAAERLGASYEQLSKVNPSITYVAVTGYKSSNAPGHDINFAAVAGHLRDAPPIPQSVDVATGLMAAFAAAASIAAGRPGYFEISMERVAYLLNLLNFAQIADGRAPQLTGGYPYYNVYSCAGGRVALGAVEPKFWERFCDLLGRPDLKARMLDPTAVAEVEGETSRRSCAELLRRAEELDVPLSLVRPLEDALRSVDLGTLLSRSSWAKRG